MAPSQLSTSSKDGSLLAFARALDVQPSPLSNANVLAATSGTSGNRASLIIVLSVVLGVIGVAALVALYFIVTQRRQLRRVRTIRILYNVDNVPGDVATDVEKGADDAKSIDDDSSVESMPDDEKPSFVAEPSNELPHVLHMPMPCPKRKRAPQPLTIIIPRGGMPADVQLIDGPGSAPVTVHSARTPGTAVTGLSSAISTAHINVVQEKVFVSNGWAPATIVYLPTNPRGKRMTARTPHKTPRTGAGFDKKAVVA